MEKASLDYDDLRKTLNKYFNPQTFPKLSLNTENYKKLENAIADAFQSKNQQILVLFGNKNTGKHTAFKQICLKNQLVEHIIYINMKLYKDELSVWNRFRREFDDNLIEFTTSSGDPTKESLRKNMDKFFQIKRTAIYIDNMEALIKIRQDFLYTFLEDLNSCNNKAFLCFATANLGCLENLERRIKSRLQFLPLYFAYSIDAKTIIGKYLACINKNLELKQLHNIIQLLQSDEVIGLIENYYQITNNISNIFKIIINTLCMLTNDDLKLLVFGSLDECLTMFVKYIEISIESFGNIKYYSIFESLPDLYKSVLICLLETVSSPYQITLANLINNLKNKDRQGLKFTTTNYIMAIKDLCDMNILSTNNDRFEGSNVILFKLNEDIKAAINKLR